MVKTKAGSEAFASEQGSIFFYIILGVALFASLSFVVTRSTRSTSVSSMSERQADILATDLITYSKKVENSVNYLLQRGCSESQLSFENSVVSGYENIVDPKGDNTCHIFHSDGAGMSWQLPPDGVSDKQYTFNGRNVISGIGSSCFGSSRCTELTLFLENVDVAVCRAVNRIVKLGTADIPVDANNEFSESHKFNGSYDSNSGINDAANFIDGEYTLCVQEGNNYHFYHVLLAR